MLYFAPYPLFVGIAALALLLYILRRKGHRQPYLFCFSVFWVYLLLVVKVTLFPIPIELNVDYVGTWERLIFTLSRVNLIPFYYAGYFNKRVIFIEVIQNIILTIPFGFGINFIARIEARKFPLLAIFVGLTIETAQLVISLFVGAYRTVDITDVILNATGSLLGFALFRLFARVYSQLIQRFNLKPRGLWRYVYHIVNREITQTQTIIDV